LVCRSTRGRSRLCLDPRNIQKSSEVEIREDSDRKMGTEKIRPERAGIFLSVIFLSKSVEGKQPGGGTATCSLFSPTGNRDQLHFLAAGTRRFSSSVQVLKKWQRRTDTTGKMPRCTAGFARVPAGVAKRVRSTPFS